MSDLDKNPSFLSDAHDLLQTYGADPTRWPLARRLALKEPLGAQPQLLAAMREEAVFERLLDLAPVVSPERERSVASRIMKAASGGPVQERRSAITPSRDLPIGGAIVRPPAGLRSRAGAAFLAASLLFGIVAGLSSPVASAVDTLAEAIGLSEDESELAMMNDGVTSVEDVL